MKASDMFRASAAGLLILIGGCDGTAPEPGTKPPPAAARSDPDASCREAQIRLAGIAAEAEASPEAAQALFAELAKLADNDPFLQTCLAARMIDGPAEPERK